MEHLPNNLPSIHGIHAGNFPRMEQYGTGFIVVLVFSPD